MGDKEIHKYVSDEELLRKNVEPGVPNLDQMEMASISEIAAAMNLEPKLVVEDLCSTDIQQGCFGSCAVLAMFGSIAANRDDVLRRAFFDHLDTEEDDEGNVTNNDDFFRMRVGDTIYRVDLTIPILRRGDSQNEAGVQKLGTRVGTETTNKVIKKFSFSTKKQV